MLACHLFPCDSDETDRQTLRLATPYMHGNAGVFVIYTPKLYQKYQKHFLITYRRVLKRRTEISKEELKYHKENKVWEVCLRLDVATPPNTLR